MDPSVNNIYGYKNTGIHQSSIALHGMTAEWSMIFKRPNGQRCPPGLLLFCVLIRSSDQTDYLDSPFTKQVAIDRTDVIRASTEIVVIIPI